MESGKTYLVYSGSGVTGTTDDNNIYTNIQNVDLKQMTKQENSSNRMGMPGIEDEQFGPRGQMEQDNTNYTGMAIGCFVIAAIITVIALVVMKKK